MKPEFKATKDNLKALVEAANNTESDGVFLEVGESMPLNDHPLKDEIFKLIDNDEIFFS